MTAFVTCLVTLIVCILVLVVCILVLVSVTCYVISERTGAVALRIIGKHIRCKPDIKLAAR